MKKLLFLLFSIATIAQPKKIYFFGDSITRGVLVSPTENYAELVAKGLGLQKVNNAISGTCMMYQTPACRVDCRHMEYKIDNNEVPTFNPETDALIFIAYLTNDVGINLPNYTIENFGKAIDKVIQGLYNSGWPVDRIKFNIRYYMTDAGLAKYPSALYGYFVPATMERYNSFASLLKSKLDAQGIQSFDHYDTLNAVEYAYSHLPDKVHPDPYFHSLIAKNIIAKIKIENALSVKNFEENNSISIVEYYNLLGQKIKEPKGIVIVKAEKNGIVYTDKRFYK
jgi:lysophospholipase L1-like esterase